VWFRVENAHIMHTGSKRERRRRRRRKASEP